MTSDARPVPRATYRLQLNAAFGFADAAAVAPYLAALGVSHVYCSPYFKARSGSAHGYDLVDHNALNPEFGSDADFKAMCDAFRAHGLGQILDFVPNHMGVGGSDNPFWLDVLEWGPDSDYADWFDIEWEGEHAYLKDKVLVPFLGDQYGAVLEAGHLALKFDGDEGSFAVWAYETHKLPICPLHYAAILGHAHAALERLGDAFAHLPSARPFIGKRAVALKGELGALSRSDAEAATAIGKIVDAHNGRPGDFGSWRRLDALIRRQFWRPAYFRVAADDINYRRFFNINDLAGIRMEVPEVFNRTHQLLYRLIGDGTLDGVRLDHVDGLFDPKSYFLRLREKAPREFHLLVEKILEPHESLREDWGVDGTTGYEFANLLTGLMVDPTGEAALSAVYADFAGRMPDFDEIVRDCKLRIMDDEMASELNVLAREARRVARSNPHTADFTSNVLHRALRQTIACFPVYRTYVDEDGASDTDRRDIDWAIARARRVETALDASVFDFLHALLTTDLVAEPRSGFSRVAVVRAAMRVQQYSGPVMAKGLEDTAFYRYNRLLALNEVGGAPERFGVSIAAFHNANRERARRTPQALLSTSTHDTKRGEDARARLAVISEIPEEWAEQIKLWSRMIRAPQAATMEDLPPHPNDEYAFYQLLLAAWPAGFSYDPSGNAGVHVAETLRTRLEGTMLKSLREAKVRTGWAAPDQAYEEAMLEFVRHALDVSRPNAFLESFSTFVSRVAPLGVRSSLVQTALKLTVPGVPDIYQGAELWDLSLVDPDNRRPVDFAARDAALQALDTDLDALMRTSDDGRIKLAVTAVLLRLRRQYPKLFQDGAYESLIVEGADADRIIAFMRESDGVRLIVVAARFFARGDIADAFVMLPEELADARWSDVLGKWEVAPASGALSANELFGTLPVSVLVSDG